jgi:hypothetical protein
MNMHQKLSIAAVAALLSVNALATDTFNITESGENLGSTINSGGSISDSGALIAPVSGADVETWSIALPLFYTFTAAPETTYLVGEPENPSLINRITITSPTTAIWESDVSAEILTYDVLSNTQTIPGGVQLFLPNLNFDLNPEDFGNSIPFIFQSFDLVLSDLPTATPDGGSTLGLMGFGLTAVGALRAVRRR